MGSLIERAIEMGISGLVKQDVEKARMAIVFDTEIDEQEKAVEALCMKLLLQQYGGKGFASDLCGIKQ